MQLDLFTVPAQTADVLGFPPARMVSCVRAAAERVAAAGKRRRSTLAHEVGLLALRYWHIGIPQARASRLADQFEQAILVELARMEVGSRTNPKGAA